MAVTSSDVARLAGVSRATVSYVLNDAPNQTISAATRQAVLSAAAQLGYRPNTAARALRTGFVPIVLMPLSGLDLTYALGQVITLLARRLADAGLTLVTDLAPLPPDEQVTAWLRLQPAALLDIGAIDASLLARIRGAGVQVLAPKEPDGGGALDRVGERLRAAQLTHLARRGCTRVVMLWPDPASTTSAFDRGMEQRLGRLAAEAGVTLSVLRAQLDRPSIDAAVRSWAALRPRPDGICAYNDFFAAALLTSLQASGVVVPDDVAVVGADDTVIAGALTPTLTSVIVDYEEFTDQAVAALQTVIAGGAGDLDLEHLPVRVVRRDSA